MKRLIILLLLGAITVSGCETNSKLHNLNSTSDFTEEETVEEETVEEETVDEEATAPEVTTSAEEMDTEIIEKVSGDNLTVAVEFTKDILNENFDRLLNAYPYDDKMKAAMAAEDTRKTILFHNAGYGDLVEIKTAYLSYYGNYQYAMIPVKCSYSNFNLQVTFDGHQNIVGFTYVAYAEKDSAVDTKIPENIVETEVSFNSEGLLLTGTFTKPKEGTDFPVVILVHGFGALDRDESIYENKPFRDIAWALAEQGIASYRYDKRTYFYTQETQKDKTFTIYEESINDAIAAAGMVSKLEDVDPKKLFILGHSLGGYVIPRIADLQQNVAGYIIMAGPAQHMKEYVMGQYEYLAQEDDIVSKEEQEEIDKLFKEIQLLEHPEKIPENKKILGAYKKYWIDLNGYDAVKKARDIDVPVLVLQGERDYQVTMDQFELWKKAFEEDDNWNFKSYPDLNHLMMYGKGKSSSSEYKTKSSVDSLVIQDLIDFIR